MEFKVSMTYTQKLDYIVESATEEDAVRKVQEGEYDPISEEDVSFELFSVEGVY